MIFVYQILKEIRKDNKYSQEALAGRIGVSTSYMADLEKKFLPIKYTMLEKWLGFLDIPKDDHLWYLQKHGREKIKMELLKRYPDADSMFISRIADALFFRDHIDKFQLIHLIHETTLTCLLKAPRQADNILDRLRGQ